RDRGCRRSRELGRRDRRERSARQLSVDGRLLLPTACRLASDSTLCLRDRRRFKRIWRRTDMSSTMYAVPPTGWEIVGIWPTRVAKVTHGSNSHTASGNLRAWEAP